MIKFASLLSARQTRIGLASLSSQTLSKNKMDTIWNERLRASDINWDNLLLNRPLINKLKLKTIGKNLKNKTDIITLQCSLLGNRLSWGIFFYE